jgi:hypothetical protein
MMSMMMRRVWSAQMLLQESATLLLTTQGPQMAFRLMQLAPQHTMPQQQEQRAAPQQRQRQQAAPLLLLHQHRRATHGPAATAALGWEAQGLAQAQAGTTLTRSQLQQWRQAYCPAPQPQQATLRLCPCTALCTRTTAPLTLQTLLLQQRTLQQ